MTTSRILVSAGWISGVTSMRSRYRGRCHRLWVTTWFGRGRARRRRIGVARSRKDRHGSCGTVPARARSLSRGELGAAVVELLQVPHRLLVVADDVSREPPGGREQLVVRDDVVHQTEIERLA